MALLSRCLERLLSTAATLLGAAVVVFVVVRVVPGNPIAMMLPPGASEEDISRLNAHYGFDRSIFEQFLIWSSGVIQGDFGTSITTRQPVLDLVLNRLPATLELAGLALVLAIAIGVCLALIGALRNGTRTEASIDIANGVALSIPDFLWGLLLILAFGVLWPIFHISGRISRRWMFLSRPDSISLRVSSVCVSMFFWIWPRTC